MTPKPDSHEERHRRRAASHCGYDIDDPIVSEWLYPWIIGMRSDAPTSSLERTCRLIATVERDARAAALEEAAKVCEYNGSKAHEDEEANIEFVCRENAKSVRALLREPPRTGPELAAEHGFPPLAESGAARVPAVVESPPDPACACMDEENSGGAVRTETRDCPVHGNPETASSEAFEQAARICEQTMPPGFRAMSQDWRDGYLVCQREVARAIRERGGK